MAAEPTTPESPPSSPSKWPLFPSEVEIPKDHPFAHDRLSRETEASQLTTLFEHGPTPLVMSLDAAWVPASPPS